jgi:hypothetical protein
MSTDRDETRIVRSWLEEGVTVLPDRVLDAVLDQLPTTPQRRATWWPARRFPIMNSTTARLGIAAAVLIIGVISLRFLFPGADVGGPEPTLIPTATPTPTATPSPAGPLPLPSSGPIAAGDYVLEVPNAPVSAAFSVGGGWNSGGWYIGSANHSISFWTVANVNEDACDWGGTIPDPEIGPTVDDLVSALDAQANTDMSAATDVVVDGYAGKRVEMTMAEVVTCRDTTLTFWIDPSGEPGRGTEGGTDTLWILDVDGHRVVIDGYVPFIADADPVQAMAPIEEVIDSIEFVLP